MNRAVPDVPLRLERVVVLSGVLIALVTAAAGATAIWWTANLHQHTTALFTHPFAVSNASLEARFAASTIRNRVLFALLTREQDLAGLEQDLAEQDRKLDANLEIVGNAYLGNQDEVRHSRTLLARWRTSREQVLRLASTGEIEAARAELMTHTSPLYEELVRVLDGILAFARAKAAYFAAQATADARQGLWFLWGGLALLGAALISTGVVLGHVVRQNIRHRDEQLARQVDHFRLALEAAPTGMLLVGPAGQIDLVNAQVVRLFGYTREELRGLGVEALVPVAHRGHHQDHRAAYQSAPTARAMGPGRQLWAQRKDGSHVAVEVGLTPLETPRGPLTLCSVLDVTERLVATRSLQESLAQKETLLREIHHRVKNNLQIISSLLGVQSRVVADDSARDVLDACRNRVHTIALIHETLYQSSDLGRVNAAEYLRPLVTQVLQAGSTGQAVPRIDLVVASLTLSMNRAVPLGLIINELVTNALKHAFPPGKPGTIGVGLSPTPAGGLLLEVWDSGRGLPAGRGDGGQAMGLKLVSALARQLKGELEIGAHEPHGTRIRVRMEEAP